MLPAQTTKQKMNMYKIAKMENKKHRRRRVDEDGTKSPPKKSPEIQGRKELQCVPVTPRSADTVENLLNYYSSPTG
jgi:hypothetical protein